VKKSVLVLLLAMLAFFVFVGISQAGQCVYFDSDDWGESYYDSSSVRYAGNIVSFDLYYNAACEADEGDEDTYAPPSPQAHQLDCARGMMRFWDSDKRSWSPWTGVPKSYIDRMKIEFCR
jgi:hypothetical protein